MAGRVSDGQKPAVPVRFPPGLAAAARRTAEQDGMNLSEWIRMLTVREISRRDGRCQACGQDIPRVHGELPDSHAWTATGSRSYPAGGTR